MSERRTNLADNVKAGAYLRGWGITLPPACGELISATLEYPPKAIIDCTKAVMILDLSVFPVQITSIISLDAVLLRNWPPRA